MRKISKKIGVICFVALAAAICGIGGMMLPKQGSQMIAPSSGQQKIYSVQSTADLAVDISDPAALAKISQYIAIVKIDSVDGCNNYSEIHQEYVQPYTYGKMTILEALSGKLPTDQAVEFYRLGGTIAMEQYYAGLSEVQKERFDSAKENSADLSVSTHIKDMFEGDIEVEAEKTYLAYLVDETSLYGKPNTFSVTGLQGGFREIKDLEDGMSSAKVLNNFTGEWESLSDIVEQ